MKDYFLLLFSASLSHTLLHLLSLPKDLYSSSFISNLNSETFPLIFFLLSQGFFLLPSSFSPSLIPLPSPQSSPQWVNYVIKITNLLHLPTFLQSHWPTFIILQDNPNITIDLPSTPWSSLRQPIIIPLSIILMMILPSISIFTLLHHHLLF